MKVRIKKTTYARDSFFFTIQFKFLWWWFDMCFPHDGNYFLTKEKAQKRIDSMIDKPIEEIV